jgi:hypothetical protein
MTSPSQDANDYLVIIALPIRRAGATEKRAKGKEGAY